MGVFAKRLAKQNFLNVNEIIKELKGQKQIRCRLNFSSCLIYILFNILFRKKHTPILRALAGRIWHKTYFLTPNPYFFTPKNI